MERNAGAVRCETNGKEFSKKSRRGRKKLQNTYECEFCGKNFKKAYYLTVHKRCHTGERPYICDICGKSFNQSCNRATHKKRHTGLRTFYCKICEKDYSSAYALAMHNMIHSGERPYPCDICGQKFRQKCHAQKHKIKIHSAIGEKSKPRTSISREKKFTSARRKQRPVSKNLDQNGNELVQLPCSGENPVSEKKGTVSRHQKQYKLNPISRKSKKFTEKKKDQSGHGKVKPRNPICEISENPDNLAQSKVETQIKISEKAKSLEHDTGNNRERSWKNSEKPNNVEHNDANQIQGKSAVGPNQCDVCRKVFKQNSYVKIHKRTHTLSKPYSCETCGKKYRYLHHLRYHLNKGNCGGGSQQELTSEQPRGYMCYYCDKVYKNFFMLEVHQRCHEKINVAKPFKCQFCSKTFKNTSHRIVHERVHTGHRPFQCDQCSMAFKQTSHLLTHKKRVHTEDRVESSTDAKVKKIQKSLIAPESSPKRGKLSLAKKTLHKCEFCSKSFKLLKQLQLHKRLHDIKFGPFRCQTCSKEFKRLANLYRHELIHTGAKPYVCELCGKACTQKSYLKIHIRKAHKGCNLFTESGKRQRVTVCSTSKVNAFEKGLDCDKTLEEESSVIDNKSTIYEDSNVLRHSGKLQSETVYSTRDTPQEAFHSNKKALDQPYASNVHEESHRSANSSELPTRTLCLADQLHGVKKDANCTKNSTEGFQFHKIKGRNLLAELKNMGYEKISSSARFQSNPEIKSSSLHIETGNSNSPLLIKESSKFQLQVENCLEKSEDLSTTIKTKAKPTTNSFSSCDQFSTEIEKSHTEIASFETSPTKDFGENKLNREVRDNGEKMFVCCECGERFEQENSMLKHCVDVH